jgi:hypothetical protein
MSLTLAAGSAATTQALKRTHTDTGMPPYLLHKVCLLLLLQVQQRHSTNPHANKPNNGCTFSSAKTHTHLLDKVCLLLLQVEQRHCIPQLPEVGLGARCEAPKHAHERVHINHQLQRSCIAKNGLTGDVVEQLPAEKQMTCYIVT